MWRRKQSKEPMRDEVRSGAPIVSEEIIRLASVGSPSETELSLLEARTIEILQSELPEGAVRLLSVGQYLVSGQAIGAEDAGVELMRQSTARLGYSARCSEVELVTLADEGEGDPWLRSILEANQTKSEDDWFNKLTETAATFVRVEPLDAAPGSAVALDAIAGLDIDARDEIASRTLAYMGRPGAGEAVIRPAGNELELLKRIWKYGFYIHAFQEAVPEALGPPAAYT